MTSSQKQTDEVASRAGRLIALAIGAVVFFGGCFFILHVNRYRIGPPVVFLWFGWIGAFLFEQFLWRAASVVADDEVDDDEFWKPVGEHDDLLHEKRTLLKALKEIEFDRQLGKMSDSDAQEMTQVYRARAIQVIKALEQRSPSFESTGSVRDEIEHELKARLRVATASKKKRKANKSVPDDAPAAEERVDDEDDEDDDDKAQSSGADAEGSGADAEGSDADAEAPDADAEAPDADAEGSDADANDADDAEGSDADAKGSDKKPSKSSKSKRRNKGKRRKSGGKA